MYYVHFAGVESSVWRQERINQHLVREAVICTREHTLADWEQSFLTDVMCQSRQTTVSSGSILTNLCNSNKYVRGIISSSRSFENFTKPFMFRGVLFVINTIPSLWLTNFHSLWQGYLDKPHFKSARHKEILLWLYEQLKAIY